MKKLTVVAATGNKNKLKEFKEILSVYGFDADIKSASDLGIHDFPEETEENFIGNALIKARFIFENIDVTDNTVVIADDSGLCVDALGGAPGVYSARYAGENASDDDRINKLLEELKDVADMDRTARFICSIATVLPDGRELCSDGFMHGIISREKHGQNGFGYDPVMYIPEFKCCVAELSADEKNKISHRGAALRKMADELKKIFKDV